MNTTDPNLVTKKKAIYAGLRAHLSKREAIEALVMWEDRYAAKTGFSVRYFVSDLVKKHGAGKIPAKQIHMGIVSALSQGNVKDLEDPTELINSYRKLNDLPENETRYSLPETEALEVLLKKLLLAIKEENKKNDIISYVRSQVKNLEVNKDLKSEFINWLRDHQYKIRVAGKVEVRELQKITTLFYVACCEYLGPTETDAILAQTLHALSNNGGATFTHIFKKLL